MRKIRLFQNITGISVIIMLFLSAGIAGDYDTGKAVPAWLYIFYIIVVVATLFFIGYTNVLKERIETNKRIEKRRAMLKEIENNEYM